MDLSDVAKILLVDDDPFNREILTELLKSQGFDVLALSDGSQVFQAMSDYAPDLILMDALMPDIDGFEVTRQLKTSSQYSHIPIIIQTGLKDHESCIKGLNLGAEGYITKPIEPAELIARTRNLLRLKKLNDLLSQNNQLLVEYHELTALPKRKLFMRQLAELLEKVTNRQEPGRVNVLAIATSNFTHLYKTHGEEFCDLLLKEIANRLRSLDNHDGIIGQLTNQNYVMAFEGPELTVLRVIKQIQTEYEKPFVAQDQEVLIFCSIGIACFPADASNIEPLIANSETALNKALDLGVQSYQFYSESMEKASIEQLALEQDLHHGLSNNEFILLYQPQVDLFNGQIKSAEALIRWRHPKLGLIPPDDFIPLIEECGLILPITQWVLNSACFQNMQWHQIGFSRFVVAVNISGQHVRSRKLVLHVAQALQQSGMPAEFLELEITEGVMVEDSELVLETLNELQKMGVKLSIDDFGTGYSSLSYLQRLPVDRIKIDQSFIRDITSNPGNATIARSIVAMSHEFDFKVIAEGVETQAQLELLKRFSCDEIQGYYFSKPVGAEELTRQLENNLQLDPQDNEIAVQRTLLIVDDEPNIVKSLKRLLRSDGYQILVAETPYEGLEILARNLVNVVISDQRMKGMNGSEFLLKVKRLYPNTVRILLTRHSNIDAAISAVNQGAIYKFFTKPWEDELLKKNIREAFKQNEMLNELTLLQDLEARTGIKGVSAKQVEK